MKTKYRNVGTKGTPTEVVLIFLTGPPADLGRGLGHLERIMGIGSSGQGLSHQPVVSYSRKNPSVDICVLREAFIYCMGTKEYLRMGWECQGRLLSVPVRSEQSSSPHTTATTPVKQDLSA